MQAVPISMNWLLTGVWLLQKSIPLKDQKSFKTKRQWKDYCRIPGFVCLGVGNRDCGMWKVGWIFCFYSFFVCLFSFFFFLNKWAQHVNKAKEKLAVARFLCPFLTVGKSVYLS